jgi:hypothetical protein
LNLGQNYGAKKEFFAAYGEDAASRSRNAAGDRLQVVSSRESQEKIAASRGWGEDEYGVADGLRRHD